MFSGMNLAQRQSNVAAAPVSSPQASAFGFMSDGADVVPAEEPLETSADRSGTKL